MAELNGVPNGDLSARDLAVRARNASRELQAWSTQHRVDMLKRVADALLANEIAIMEANAQVRHKHLHICQVAAMVVTSSTPTLLDPFGPLVRRMLLKPQGTSRRLCFSG